MTQHKGFKSTDEAYRYLIEKSKAQGYSQGDLAKKLGIHRQQITNSLRRGNVKIDAVENLALILGVDVIISLT